MSDSTAPTPSDALPRYEVTKYAPPYTFSAPRLVVALVALGAGASGMGYLFHWPLNSVPQYELLWGLGLGVGIGLFGTAVAYAALLRHPVVAILCGLAAGGVGLGVMRYATYLDAGWEMEGRARQWAAVTALKEYVWKHRNNRNPPVKVVLLQGRRWITDPVVAPPGVEEAIQPLIERLVEADQIDQEKLNEALLYVIDGERGPPPILGDAIDRPLREAVERIDFFSYLHWKARQGIQIALPRLRSPLHLGQTWTWIYWTVEAIVILGIVAACLVFVTTFPACTQCPSWLEERELGRLRLLPDVARTIFETGAVMSLAGEDLATQDGAVLLKVWTCPQCGDEAPIIVRVARFTKKGWREQKENVTAPLVYPGSALAVLEALATPVPSAAKPASPTPPEEATPAP